ncbi:MAG TPA: MDR family MFS transporter [Candidatus Dormibacteraeota bacterium]|nr:MDR family MFS transporter [Candidatus Dormibacteraeota bacterium]
MTRSSSPAQVVLATVGVAMALLLAALDQTIVGVAMPRIVSELHGLNYYAWVTTAYLITSTALVPVAGKLGDMFGRKPFLLAGMIGFVAASALCGTSQNMVELVLFRALQGVFGGVLFASTFAVLADVFPPAQRAKMSGLFGAVFGLSSVVGPTLGGFLTDGPGWRWVFYVNVPLGIAAVILVAAQLPFVRSAARIRDIDWVGTALLFAGLAPLLIALSMTRDHAWVSPQVLGLLAGAGVALVAFYFVERRVEHPVVPFQLFKMNVFAVPAVISFFSGIGMFGAVIFVPLLYQGVLGTSATNSGQLLTPMMLAVVVTSTATGAFMARIPAYRFLATVALSVMILGLVLLARVGPGASPLEVTRDIIIIGAGLGVTFPFTFIVIQAGLPHRLIGVATSQLTFWRSLGGTIGTAVLGSILTNRLPIPYSRLGLASTLRDLFMVAAVVAAVSVIASVFLREVPLIREAEGTPVEVEAAA